MAGNVLALEETTRHNTIAYRGAYLSYIHALRQIHLAGCQAKFER